LNEADVAYAAEVADLRGRTRGRTIFISGYIPSHLTS
jgi:hypothetical protein